MLTRIIKIIFILVLVAGLAWTGVCVYASFFEKTEGEIEYELPDSDTVRYSFYIENTGNLILANDYEQHGENQKLYILHGYYELVGSEFQHRTRTLVLDEKIFGKITVKDRR